MTLITTSLVESWIVMRLQQEIGPQLEIVAYPDKPESWRFMHPRGTILVRYHGAQYGELESLALSPQERPSIFELAFLSRNLRGHFSAYEMLEMGRVALQGWRPKGCKATRILKDAFVSQADGVWTYGMQVLVPYLAMAKYVPPPVPVLTDGIPDQDMAWIPPTPRLPFPLPIGPPIPDPWTPST